MERPKDIIIHRKSHASVTIECNDTIARELSQFFSAFAPNYRWSPLYKSRQWDGKIRFFKFENNSLPIGLVEKVFEFAKIGKYSIQCNYERFNNINREDFQKFIISLNIPFPLRDYQFEAAYQCVCKKNMNVLANTRSGKSLIVYILVRFMVYMKLKTMILVPQKTLVEQLYGDFESYGWTECKKYTHKVYGGQVKYFDCPVTISSYASMVTTKVKDINPYESFDCMIVDECFIKGSKVNTPNGYKNIEDINVDDEVYSYNKETLSIEVNKVLNTYKNATISDKLIKITISDDKVITCTPNHKFYIKNEFDEIELKEAYKLTEKDTLIPFT